MNGGAREQQSRSVFGYELDQDLAATVDDDAIEGRCFGILGYGRARLVDAAFAAAEQVDGVARGVLEEEPRRIVSSRSAEDGQKRRQTHHPPASATAAS